VKTAEESLEQLEAAYDDEQYERFGIRAAAPKPQPSPLAALGKFVPRPENAAEQLIAALKSRINELNRENAKLKTEAAQVGPLKAEIERLRKQSAPAPQAPPPAQPKPRPWFEQREVPQVDPRFVRADQIGRLQRAWGVATGFTPTQRFVDDLLDTFDHDNISKAITQMGRKFERGDKLSPVHQENYIKTVLRGSR
jgi:hypothetical protein